MKRLLLSVAFLSLALPAYAQPKTDHKAYTQKIPGMDAQFDMVPIPAGEFLMGSPDSEKGRRTNEGPQHKVKVHAFWMGKCEVTWEEYRTFQRTFLDLEENPNKKPDVEGITYPTKPYVPEDYGHGYGQKPAICMTHHNAMEYCRWLSGKTGQTYRLPTEAEWEYACRAGTTTPYFWGTDEAKLGDYAWFKGNSPDADHEDGTTHKVGMKKPNPWGLHDMAGNVMEWTIDQYDKDGYAKFAKMGMATNPLIPPTADKWAHVTRGGSWKDDDLAVFRSASRIRSHPEWMKHDPQDPRSIWWLTRFDKVGFRVVRPVTELDALKGFKSKVTKQSSDELADDGEPENR